MDESEQTMRRYLLGELSESEQTALEEKYFTDPKVFDQVVKAEQELVDNYARGRLSRPVRERFEQSYLIHPKRRERARFAETLVIKLDQIEASNAAAEQAGAVSWWQRLLESLRSRRLGFSIALATLLVMLGGVWFVIETRRLRQELSQTQAARTDQEKHERELEQEVAGERMRAEELTTELERLRRGPQPAPTPQAPSAPTFASLILTIGGFRGTDTAPPARLVIPPGTEQVRLQLNLKERDYASYRASLQAAGGPEVFSRQGLKPRATKSGASIALIVPARKFATGDYILTLRGVNQGGETDDVSKSIFRVEKR